MLVPCDDTQSKRPTILIEEKELAKSDLTQKVKKSLRLMFYMANTTFKKILGLHPYKTTTVRGLKPGNSSRQVAYERCFINFQNSIRFMSRS